MLRYARLSFIRKNALVTKQDPRQSASANFITEQDLRPQKILQIWIRGLTHPHCAS